MVTDQDYWDEANNQIELLHRKIAEREAECLKLREALFASDELLRNLENSGNFYGLCVMEANQEALSTPPSTSYLEQWEKNRYQVVGYFGYEKVHGLDVWSFSGHQCKLHNALLYARKD